MEYFLDASPSRPSNRCRNWKSLLFIYIVWNRIFFQNEIAALGYKRFFSSAQYIIWKYRGLLILKETTFDAYLAARFFSTSDSFLVVFFRRQSWQRLIRSVGMTALRRFVDSTRRTFTTATFTIKQFTMMFLYVLPIILEWNCW